MWKTVPTCCNPCLLLKQATDILLNHSCCYFLSVITWHSFSIFYKATYSSLSLWWWLNIWQYLKMPSLIHESFFDYSYCVFNVFGLSQIAPTTAQRPSPPQELPLCWFDLYLASFSAALWIKLLRGECLREAQSAASQLAPSCSQTEAFQIGFHKTCQFTGTSLAVLSRCSTASELWPKRRRF